MRPFVLLSPLLLVAGSAGRLATVPAPAAPPRALAVATLQQTQFVPNVGQWHDAVRYAVVGDTAGWLHDDGFTLQLARDAGDTADLAVGARTQIGCVVRTRFLDASLPTFERGAELATRRHFLRGAPAQWRRDVPAFERVTMRGVRPGIDVVFRPLAPGKHGFAEYDLMLAPGADLAAFRARCEGVEELRLDDAGRLCARLWDGASHHELVLEAPVAWQQTAAGPRPLAVAFRLLDRTTYGFVAPQLDPALAAVVDPGVVWSSYLGGGSADRINAMRWRPGVGVWVAGWAGSNDFPTTVGAYRTVGGSDAFVARLADDGQSLQFATYLGGGRADEIRGLDLGPGDTPVVVGFTQSTDFPVTPGALQSTYRGASLFLDIGDGFVTRLDAAGSSLLASTYLGGLYDDVAEAVHVDAAGAISVAGWTSSPDLPVSANAPQPTLAGVPGATSDGFVVRLAPNAQSLQFGTFDGGLLNDHFVAVDRDPASGDTVAAGWTSSPDFPTTLNAFGPWFGGQTDAIVARINGAGTSFVFNTYLGTSEFEYAHAVRFGANGSVWVGGSTDGPNYPVTLQAPQITPGGQKDGFVTQLAPNGQTLQYSTRLGGPGPDKVRGLDLATSGIAVVGEAGNGFPLTSNAVQSTFGEGTLDGFLALLTNGGSTLAFATYLGGAAQDMVYAVDLADSGLVVLAGRSFSADFPVAPPGYQTQRFGAEDGVVAKLDLVTTFGDGLEIQGESSLVPQLVAPGEHELLAVRLQNLTARDLAVDDVRILVAGVGDARARATGLRVLAENVAGGAATVVAGPLAVPVDDAEFVVPLHDCLVPGSGALRLRFVATLSADPGGATAEVAVAIAGVASWSLRAIGAGGGPSVAVLAPGRATGTPRVLGALPGDADGDGERTVLDVRRQLSGLGGALGAADGDGDGVATAADVDATHAAVLGRSTVFAVPPQFVRGSWLTIRGAFLPGPAVVTLGGRVLQVGAVTTRALVVQVPDDMLAGTQELVVAVAGRTVHASFVVVP